MSAPSLRNAARAALGSVLSVIALGACIDLTAYRDADVPGAACTPGAVEPCFTGAPEKEDVGACRRGVHACKPDGSGFDACMGEVKPTTEACDNRIDDDCDGVVNNPEAGCACAPGDAVACYEGPAGTDGVGACAAGSKICMDDGLLFGPCLSQVLPSIERCDTDKIDESCDALATCTGAPKTALVVGSPEPDGGFSIGIDEAGDVLVGGVFTDSMSFGPSSACAPLTAAPGGEDIFVAKLDPKTLACIWAVAFGSPGAQSLAALAVGEGGDVTILGTFANTITFGDTTLPLGSGPMFIARLDKAGASKWARGFGSSVAPVDVILGADGSAIVTGFYAAPVDFGPPTTPLVFNGGNDIFIAKLDAMGNPLWSKGFGGAGDDHPAGVALAKDGRIFMAGFYLGKIDFGAPAGSIMSPDPAVYLATLDSNGNPLSVSSFGDSPASQFSTDIAVDALGNVIMSGNFDGTIDFGPPTAPLVGAGNYDAFVVKLTPGGKPLWSKIFTDGPNAGLNGQYVDRVAVDAAGNIVATGSFLGKMALDAVELTFAGGTDAFAAKLSPTGGVLWAQHFGDLSNQVSHGVAMGPLGDVFLVGEADSSIGLPGDMTAPIGKQDVFVVKLSP